jgi:iron complex transport system ATP-binding protein
MIEITDIHYRHTHAPAAVLRGVSLSARPGMLTAVLGPNGSGKTTLFKCIAGLWKPQQGDVAFRGRSMTGYSPGKRAKIIGVVPQEHEPPFPYSVIDAVTMGRAAHLGMFSTPSRSDYAKALEAIKQVGIDHLRDRPYTRISGGERQLVLIARVLAQESPVMLLDEPTSHLDFRNQVQILKRVKQIIREKSVTALMTIHDPNLAMLFSDSVVMLNDGRAVCQGSPAEIMSEENIREIYGIDVTVIPVNGSRVIVPRLSAT